MFCPCCGLEEKQSNQFCRACGSNLNVVRTALERPDSITQSAATARDEIGRAIAFKIREAKSPGELATVAEDVLPEIEKFLESPEEKRLRRVRKGTMVASIGLGAAIGFSIAAVLMNDAGVFFVAGLGMVTLLQLNQQTDRNDDENKSERLRPDFRPIHEPCEQTRNRLIKIQSRQKAANPAQQIEQPQNKTALPTENHAQQNDKNEQCVNQIKIHNFPFSVRMF